MSRPKGALTVLLGTLVGIVVTASPPAYAGQGPPTSAGTTTQHRLVVAVTGLFPNTLQAGHHLVVTGTVRNPSTLSWDDAKAYLQISEEPATTIAQLDSFADIGGRTGLGSPIIAAGTYGSVGNVAAGEVLPFRIRVPYRDLAISGAPGVYRVGIKVIATSSAGVRDLENPARANTLLPLLPAATASIVPAPTLTLLPLTAPVARIGRGTFANDSLATSLGNNGRLSDIMNWALRAPRDTVQVVADPALLTALTDMSAGYRVQPASSPGPSTPGTGRTAAARWLARFRLLQTRQPVLFLPWGAPAGNALMAAGLPGPLTAAVRASADFVPNAGLGTTVAGWLGGGDTGIRALQVMHRAGADIAVIAQSSLPALTPSPAEGRESALPSLIEVKVGRLRVPALVTATSLAGYVTAPHTSALQFRQRLVADATVRALDGASDSIRVTALPFNWDPGPTTAPEGLRPAFRLPVITAESAIGVATRTAASYVGAVRPGPHPPALRPALATAIRAFQRSGRRLAAILNTADATRSYLRADAMCGSREWLTSPVTGLASITRQGAAAGGSLAKVTVTGPPFVAMSSASGRFPLTVTNGLQQAVTLKLAVTPANPALKIAPIAPFSLPGGQRRDIQVVSTAHGSGLTSVRARLATPSNAPFGKPWRFSVRATQIGLVIWIVMAVGGGILFIAAGYRIVQRLRGAGPPRRKLPT